ncbi:sulfite exporter TauE/SafE family protein [Pelagibaculum spongiae]|uniref:Probable membrane transporter protein n=1 Tax=Pelagibaculum spongiae TaxID=2080658 RepID=A0A2V1GZI6_9GAMM|nr:sulfite exporter TauE/SafE family protein [Pelagibaculum spongiae]PVZ70364.1 hypothetical protein DC094_07155 [Pelagibaculum spongiae]
MDMITFSAALAIMLAAATLHGVIGFGQAVLAAPLLFLLNPEFIPAPILICGIVMSLMNSWRYRSELQLPALANTWAGYLPGSLMGGWMLAIADQQIMSWLLVGVVGIALLVSMTRITIPFNRYTLSAFSVSAGVMGTVSSISGPPLALVWQHQPVNSIRGNLGATFASCNLIALMVLAWHDKLNLHLITLGLSLAPAAILGNWLGSKLAPHVSHHHMRMAMLAVCFISCSMVLFC